MMSSAKPSSMPTDRFSFCPAQAVAKRGSSHTASPTSSNTTVSLPFRILAVTFTNKAANEMKERLDVLVEGGVSRDLWVSTFHATCARILRRDIEKLGEPADAEGVSPSKKRAYTRDFTIFDTSEQATLVKDVLRQLNYSDKQYNPRAVLSLISRAKNESISPQKYRDNR